MRARRHRPTTPRHHGRMPVARSLQPGRLCGPWTRPSSSTRHEHSISLDGPACLCRSSVRQSSLPRSRAHSQPPAGPRSWSKRSPTQAHRGFRRKYWRISIEDRSAKGHSPSIVDAVVRSHGSSAAGRFASLRRCSATASRAVDLAATYRFKGLTGFDIRTVGRVCDPSCSDSLNGAQTRSANEHFALAA